MTTDAWSPAQYERFQQEREQPFYDLLALVEPRSIEAAVDLGCGTGALTKVLHQERRVKATLGIDSSPAMLARAKALRTAGLRFELGDLATFEAPDGVDLIFSNAALQWVGSHETLLPRLWRSLRRGGQLAVQVPANHDHPAHLIAADVASAPEFREAFSSPPRLSSVESAPWYARALHGLGAEAVQVRVQVYTHELPGPDAVVEWMKGTTLTAWQQVLPPATFERFVERYRQAFLVQAGAQRPYLFTFKRLLFSARRPDTAATSPRPPRR